MQKNINSKQITTFASTCCCLITNTCRNFSLHVATILKYAVPLFGKDERDTVYVPEIPQKNKNMTIKQITFIYIITINIVTFFLYGIDKWKAKHAKWRIPEATLLGLAAIGGSVGAWLGMKVWHHKTMHKKFKYGIPLIFIAQMALIWLTSCKGNQSIASATPIQKHQLKTDHSPNIFLIMYNVKTDKAALLKAIKEYMTPRIEIR